MRWLPMIEEVRQVRDSGEPRQIEALIDRLEALLDVKDLSASDALILLGSMATLLSKIGNKRKHDETVLLHRMVPVTGTDPAGWKELLALARDAHGHERVEALLFSVAKRLAARDTTVDERVRLLSARALALRRLGKPDEAERALEARDALPHPGLSPYRAYQE